MDFRLTEDQRHLRDGVRALLAGRFGRDRLRAAVDAADRGAPAVDRALWAELAAAGLFGLRLPEEAGGAGLGTPEAVLAFEEAGRALLPGPLVATHLAAPYLPSGSPSSGARPPGRPSSGDPPPGAAVVALLDTARRPLLVEHLADADAVLVLDGRVRWAAPEAFEAAPAACVDPLTTLSAVEPSAVGLGTPAPGEPLDADAGSLRRTGALLTSALQLGIAGRVLELAVAHARGREQFGRPIGSFQAVQHLCADMLVRTETARAAVYAASVTEEPADVAAAKLLADEAAVRGARDCVQVHGGMGFTWEADPHLYLKRAWLHATQYADAAANEESLAAALRPPARAGAPGGPPGGPPGG